LSPITKAYLHLARTPFRERCPWNFENLFSIRESIFVFQSTPTLVISPRMGFVGFSPKGVLLHAKIKINRPFIDHNLL